MTPEDRYSRLTSAEVRSWLNQPAPPDPHELLLHPPPHLTDIAGDVADQLTARQKAKKKLPAWYDEEKILWPPPLSIEQASSALTADFKARLVQGSRLTDLTGGTGIDCLAFAKRFDQVEYVEQDPWLCRVFAHNSSVLGIDNVTICNQTASSHLDSIQPGQSIYLDPARRDTRQNKIFRLEDCSPNVLELVPALRQKGCRILIKLSPLLDIRQLTQKLGPEKVVILSLVDECKELLAVLGEKECTAPLVQAVDLETDRENIFEFRLDEENQAHSSSHDVSAYLYVPNAAIMKAGAFKLIGKHYNLKKIAPNTHLYTSENPVPGFPGRVFRVIEDAVSSRTLKKNHKGQPLHVISRNYPVNAARLTSQYGLIESGDHYLIAFTDRFGKKKMVIAERV